MLAPTTLSALAVFAGAALIALAVALSPYLLSRREKVDARRFKMEMAMDRADVVREMIRDSEVRHHLRLTPHAREFLALPIYEAVDDGPFAAFEEARRSIDLLMETMRDDPIYEPAGRRARGEESRWRNCQSVVRALHSRFCGIPPFCDRRD